MHEKNGLTRATPKRQPTTRRGERLEPESFTGNLVRAGPRHPSTRCRGRNRRLRDKLQNRPPLKGQRGAATSRRGASPGTSVPGHAIPRLGCDDATMASGPSKAAGARTSGPTRAQLRPPAAPPPQSVGTEWRRQEREVLTRGRRGRPISELRKH